MNQMSNVNQVSNPLSSDCAPHRLVRPDFERAQRFAFIQSTWHRPIVDVCRTSFLTKIGELGVSSSQIDQVEVPGSFEIPLHTQILAKSGRYTGIVAAGLVVDGGIYRHEFVASTVISALMQVQLSTSVPVFSAVLTPHHFHEHAVHDEFFRRHFEVKGAEVAEACMATLLSLNRLAD